MNTLAKFEESLIRKDIPELRPGYVVKVYQKIKEVIGGVVDSKSAKKAVKSGKKEEVKERIQIFEGTVISIRGNKQSLNATVTVRKISNGVGVERIFPLYLPSIEKVEVVKKTRIRRAKLYYLRTRTGKAAKAIELKNDKVQNVAEVKVAEAKEQPKQAETTETKA